VQRHGRSMIYAARYDTMNALIDFLRENCCRGVSTDSAVSCKPKFPRKHAKERV
jgi:ArsR family transcriptional regulator, arsenate/arsenite/antimonite-responsive transcriptional repressor